MQAFDISSIMSLSAYDVAFVVLHMLVFFWLGWYTAPPRAVSGGPNESQRTASKPSRQDQQRSRNPIREPPQSDHSLRHAGSTQPKASDSRSEAGGDSGTDQTSAQSHGVLGETESHEPAADELGNGEKAEDEDQSSTEAEAEEEGEGEENPLEVYSDGHARIVLAIDGDQPCSALLLEPDLSANIRQAISYSRRYRKEKVWARRQIERIKRFHWELTSEIRGKEMLIESFLRVRYGPYSEWYRGQAEGRDQPSFPVLNAENPDFRLTEGEAVGGEDQDNAEWAEDEDVRIIRKDVELLRGLEQHWDFNRKVAETTISDGAEVLLDFQADVLDYIEYAFIEAQMVGLDEGDVRELPPLDVAEQFLKFSEGREYELAPNSFRDWKPEQVDPEEWAKKQAEWAAEDDAKDKILQAIVDARKALDVVSLEWNRRIANREEDYRLLPEVNGQPKPSQAEFELQYDARWEEVNGPLTQQMKDAEEAMAMAHGAAADAGVDPNDDPSWMSDYYQGMN